MQILSRHDIPELATGVQRVVYRSAVDGAEDWALVLEAEGTEGLRDRGTKGGGGGIWIVNVHGHGAAGDQLFTRPDIRDGWLPRFHKESFGIIAPNLRGNAWMGPSAAADLRELLAWHKVGHPGARYVFFGGSMGGTSNLIYAVLHPQDVAAVVALGAVADVEAYVRWCRSRTAGEPGVLAEIAAAIEAAYGDDPRKRAEAYAANDVLANVGRLTMPVFLAHGRADGLMPVEQLRALAAALGDRGDFRYVETPGDHDSPLRLAGQAVDWLRETLGGGGACQSGR